MASESKERKILFDFDAFFYILIVLLFLAISAVAFAQIKHHSDIEAVLLEVFIRLLYYENHSINKISEILESIKNTVKTKLRCGRKEIKNIIKKG